jgi:hypothetical protein
MASVIVLERVGNPLSRERLLPYLANSHSQPVPVGQFARKRTFNVALSGAPPAARPG